MADGFEVVPEELDRAATGIGEAVREIAGMAWPQPGGDYGHPGLGAVWTDFLEDAKIHVDAIHDAALGHGIDLRDTANHYRESDIANGRVFGNCWIPNGGIPDIGNGSSGIPGGGWAGGVTGVGAAPANNPVAPGIINPEQVGGITNQEANDLGIYY